MKMCFGLIFVLLQSCSTPISKTKTFTFSCFTNGQLSATGTNDGLELYEKSEYYLCKIDEINHPL